MNFIPEPDVLIQFFIASAILSITPGPDMTLFVGKALGQGRAAGLAALAGANCGITIHTLLVVGGISALIVASPTAFFILKLVGAAYLLFLAYRAIRFGSAFSPGDTKQKKQSLLRNFLTGITVNLSNPKIILFFMTFLPQFVSASDPNAPAKLLFLGILFIIISLPITVPMIIAADSFSKLLSNYPRITRITDWMFAGIFGAFAFSILFNTKT